jgi:phosphoribosylformylglycinamidine synthase
MSVENFASEPEVTQALAVALKLSTQEYQKILALLGRSPSYAELGVFSAMWNEHCSYKSSKKWLRTLPTEGPQVIQGPGENAGVIDIGDGQALVFKVESHNHPSYIEPYQGAMTGMGGILRDVFTMGARPIAAMNALSFGAPQHPQTKHLLSGVVAGIGGYGNAFGVPTVGGALWFDPGYNGNCLVNAFAAGLADANKIFYAKAAGVGRPIVYLGAKTGRDGVGGSTMASDVFGEAVAEMRPTVQVGDPFKEKCLLEACLELMKTGAVVAIQDMGAAGLTCSAVEMGDKGDLGIRLDLDKVPTREQGMSAFEMLLSESQERMLMVLDPSKTEEARSLFEKWELDFAIVGETIAEDRFIVEKNGRIEADLPLKALCGAAPEYDRLWTQSPAPPPLAELSDSQSSGAVLLLLMQSPELCSRAWVWEQYDSQVMGDTVSGPGGDAGVVRIHGSQKGAAFTADVTPRYCAANPFEGGKQAVAEAFRNLIAVGAKPLAASDNLNFGSPERPEIMGQFVGCVQGIGAACRALDMPIVSGNVSLYNETDGHAIPPTPTICAVGIMDDVAASLTTAFKVEGDVLILVGETKGHMGQSLYARAQGAYGGDAPPVDLAAERAAGDLILSLAERRFITAAHDLSDGGLAVAASEMALAGGIGCIVAQPNAQLLTHEWLFCEDQGRYLIVVDKTHVNAVIAAARRCTVPAEVIGDVRGQEVDLCGDVVSLSALRAAKNSWLPQFMA